MNRAARFESVVGMEYNLTNFNGILAQVREEEIYVGSSKPVNGRFVSAEGIARLVEDGVSVFQYITEHSLPHNLVRSAMSGSVGIVGPYGRRLSEEDADAEISSHSRFGGWLKAVAELPAVRRVIQKTQSSRGVNSPRTTVDLWSFFEKNPSPGALERKLWQVRRRAVGILAAYEGNKMPSWKSLAQALMVERRVGKAAIIAVAISISGNSGFRNYREAREWLVDYHLCKVADESDGVESRREEKPRLEKFGMAVHRIAIPRRNRRGFQVGVDFQFLVSASNGRTYHSNWGGPREALQQALSAWKKQDELAALDAELVGFLNGSEGFCPLVVRQDSYSAGNCSSGTESWLQRHGWGARMFLPSPWLVPHLGDSYVRGVAMKVFQDLHCGEQKAA